MGMSDREKYLEVLEELRKTLNVDKGIEFCEEIEALDYGLNVMHKYQKIEEIINAPIGGTSAKYNAIVNLVKYSKVLEDGNVD